MTEIAAPNEPSAARMVDPPRAGGTAAAGHARFDPILAVFFASGISGLIYESAWTHYLKILVGHAAHAQTLVLAVFIGGLAIGAALCGRVGDRLQNPLRVYAIVEAVIGVIALAFHGIFQHATAWAYGTLFPACGPEGACLSQWLLCIALIAPQSILLGATFPLVSSALLRRHPDAPGHGLAALYFVNSLGAVAGVLLSAYVLIPRVGLPGALTSAGLLNVAIAIVAWFLAKRPAPPLRLAPATLAGQPPASRGMVRLLLAVAFLTGLSSFVYEIAWIRMLSFVLGASTHSFELMLASFILGLALGGWWIRARMDTLGDPVRFLGYVQLAMGALAAATLALYHRSFDLMAWMLAALSPNAEGFLLFNAGSAAIACLVMLPATFCAGMTLPLITYRLLRSDAGERSIGFVYAANTLGALVGVALAVHLLLESLGLAWTLAAGALVDVALGAALLARPARPVPRRVPAAACAAALAVVMGAALLFPVDGRRSASGVFRTGVATLAPEERILFQRDGKTASVAVVAHSDVSLAILTNGKPDAAVFLGPRPNTDEYTMTLLALLPLGHRPEARRAAVIGFGSGMSSAVMLGSPHIERVDTIEIEPVMMQGARHFGARVAAAFADPRSRIVVDDAKAYFARTRERYDIIVSEPSNPWVSGVASLFTREFYARAAEHLLPGGVLSQWLHVYDMDATLLASIVAAVATAFPDFVLYAANDGDVVLVARKGGGSGSFDEAVLGWPAMQPLLQRLSLQAPGMVRERVLGSSATLQPFFARYGAPVNSDFHPFVDRRAAEARFRRLNAAELHMLRAAPTPMLEMLDPAGTRSTARPAALPDDMLGRGTAAAWRVHDIALERAPGAAAPGASLESAGYLARAWARCNSDLPFPPAMGALLSVAHSTTPYLDAQASSRLWRALAAPACVARLRPEERAAIELLAAAGERHAARIVEAGVRVLNAHTGPPDELGEYALAATATALICLGQRRSAAELLIARARWVRPHSHPEQWRWLEAQALHDGPRAATRACPAA